MATDFSPPPDKTLNTNEQRKFAEIESLGVVVKTLSEINGGELTILAPKDTVNKVIKVTAVATPIPVIANQIAISIFNTSLVETIKLGKSDVLFPLLETDLGGKTGWPIGPEENQNEAVTSDTALYLIADTGKEVLVQLRYYKKEI